MTRSSGGDARGTGPALEAMYQLVRWLIPTVDRFPRRQKFLLGDRIQSAALAGLERLVEATFTRSRSRLLDRVNVDLDKLRLLLRLAKELGYLDTRRYRSEAGEAMRESLTSSRIGGYIRDRLANGSTVMWMMKSMGAVVAAGAVVAGAAPLDDVQAVGEYRPGVRAPGVPAGMARVGRGDAPALDADWTVVEGGEETVFAH